MPSQSFTSVSFQTFGDLLKYLRRREQLTQLELSIIVGYSEAQIGRLEKNQRRPDLTALKALFIPALHCEHEPELITRFLELAQAARQDDAPAPGIAPYKGLLFFDESDSALFFGRETLTARLADRVAGLAIDASTRFLAIVGASGSGKSSLVRAGLAVTLNHAGWDVRIFTPGANPLRALEMQINVNQAKAESDRILILIDQFEETFTLCHIETERAAFIEKILSLASSGKIIVVIALRADFYSHCAQYPLLRQAVAAEQEYIGQMTADELRRAIEEPARRGGWEFEPGLVDVLLNDIGADGMGQPEPGALPLLSHALLATWERRRGRTFMLDSYHASGGVRGAIAETAESVFTDQLNHQQQELARDVFLRLTELGEGTEDTRRRAALNELVRQSVEAIQLRIVLNILAEARLITLNEDSAEVAHEALIREWQRLHQWLTQDRESLHLHRHLTESAKEWESLGRDASELYRGSRLAQAHEWADANKIHLNEAERVFISASIEQEQHDGLEREAQRQRELATAHQLAEEQKQHAEEQAVASRQLRRRAIWLTCALILTLLTTIFAGVFASRNATLAMQNAAIAQTAQAAQAESQSNFTHAEAQRLAAEANALSKSDGSSALIALLSLRSLNIQYSPQAEAALDGAARLNYPHKLFIGHTSAISNVGFTPDGKYILTTALDNTFRIWDAQSGEEFHRFGFNIGLINSMTLSPNGRFALTTSDNASKVTLWNIEAQDYIQGFIVPAEIPNVAVFSQDGKSIFTGAISVVRVIDIQTRNLVRSFFLPAPAGLVIYISHDGKFALTTSTTKQKTVQLWSLEDAVTKIKDFTYNATTTSTPQRVAVSPNGQSVLIGYVGGDAALWNMTTGNIIQVFKGHAIDVRSVVFSPNGNYVLTGGSDKTARLWDVQTGNELLRLTTTGAVDAVAFSPNGQSVLTGCADGAVELWDIRHQSELPLFQEGYSDSKNVSHSAVVFSPDGKFLATGGTDGLRLWSTVTGQLQRIFTDSGFIKYGMRFSTDGKYLFSGDSSSGVISQWNLQSGERVRQFTASFFSSSTAKLNDIAISPDGRFMIATGSQPAINQAFIWETQTNEQSGRLFFQIPNGYVTSLAFSPNGKFILTATNDGEVRIMDAQTGMLLKRFVSAQRINDAAFSPDGKYVVTAGANKLTYLWDFETVNFIRQFNGHTDILYRVTFSLDGKILATASADGTVRLWDVQTGQELRRFTGPTAGVENMAFSPDGKYVATVSDDGTTRLWNVDYHTTMEYLCSILLRDFTDEERAQYGITDTTPTCPKP